MSADYMGSVHARELRKQLAARDVELAEAKAQLQTVHNHVKEALELLGVDVSVDGYIPDSWTLREQCAKAKAEIERLREVGSAVLANAYLDDDVINRHSSTTVSCKALRDMHACLTSAPSAPPVERPMIYWNEEGKLWEMFFAGESYYAQPGIVHCDLLIGRESGDIVGMDVYASSLRKAATGGAT